jgi:hypothetical protein
MGDDHRLFAKVHQSNEVMGQVQAVILNTPEARQMVIMMNKNLPVYVSFSLQDQGLPESFFLELLKLSCCLTLVAEINSCMWDLDSGVLTSQHETNKNQHVGAGEDCMVQKLL